MSEDADAAGGRSAYLGWRVVALGFTAFLILVPVTLPVTVLRGLVQERFDVSETLTSLFMAINMVGAALAAPLAGAFADRLGRRRLIIVAALVADAVLLFALALPISFGAFLVVRFFEGCAHITALSLLLTLAARTEPARRGRVMGAVGGGITLGVAIGAPVGGAIGGADPLVPLRAGSALVLVAAVVAAWVLREGEAGEARPSFSRIFACVNENRALVAPLTFAFADRFTVGFFTTTFSLYLTRIHDLTPARIGILMACLMLPVALLSYPFGRLAEQRSRVAMLCGGSVVYGVGMATLGWWPITALPALMLGLGVASAVMFVPSLVLTTEVAPGEIRATALGAFNAAGSLGFIVGPLTGGIVSEGVAARATWLDGYRAAFGVAGASEILCVLVALPFLLQLVRAGRTK